MDTDLPSHFQVKNDQNYGYGRQLNYAECNALLTTGRRNRLKGARGRGTKAKEKPPVFGMIQRGGQVVIRIPHRGISQEKLPLYLGFFECLHNIKRRGKAAMSELLELLLR